MSRNGIDHTGKDYEFIKVIERVSNSGRHRMWKCICKRCEKEFIARAPSIKKRKSCGCYDPTKGVPAHNRKAFGESSRNQLFASYKQVAKNRGLNFSIDIDLFTKLTTSECYWCGISPKQIHRSKANAGGYLHNGIDRVDNRLGYIPLNCVACCKRCNTVKSNMTLEEFKNWVRKVNQRLNELFKMEIS